jgi:hypothetical protein
MNRVFHPSANIILFRMSDNAEHYKAEHGKFKVTYRANKGKNFTSLMEAFLFYIALDDEADLWEMGEKRILIEKKIKMCLN